MDTSRVYYEKYWNRAETSPDVDPLTEKRAALFLGAVPGTLRVLDLGCGSGRASKLLLSNGHNVFGLEVSETALRKARRVEGAKGWVQASCDGPLPFAEKSFDAVYCAEVIEHLIDPQTVLTECHRILKPSGILFLTTPYHGLIKNLVLMSMAFDRHFNVRGDHIRFFSVRSLRSLLSDNGFRPERTWRLGRYAPLWKNMAVLARRV